MGAFRLFAPALIDFELTENLTFGMTLLLGLITHLCNF